MGQVLALSAGGHQHFYRLADGFLAAVAEHLLGSGIEHPDDLPVVHRDDGIHGGIDDAGQPVFGFLAHQLVGLAFGDVQAVPDEAHQLALCIELQAAVAQQPAHVTRKIGHAEFGAELLLPVACKAEQILYLRGIVRVHHLEPQPPLQLCGLLAAERQPHVVDVAQAAIGIATPHQHPACIGQFAEVGLAGFQLGLRPLHVVAHDVEAAGQRGDLLGAGFFHAGHVGIAPHECGVGGLQTGQWLADVPPHSPADQQGQQCRSHNEGQYPQLDNVADPVHLHVQVIFDQDHALGQAAQLAG